MDKPNIDKVKLESSNIVDENFEKLASLFPNVVTETIIDGQQIRAIDKDKLMQEINAYVLDGLEERYNFSWPDKRKSVVLANAPTRNTLRACKEDSKDFERTENLYIEGDNLEVLKLLRNTYMSKVKMIYIDPPYNTGKDFVYQDNFYINRQDYLENSGQFDEDGNRLFENTEANGRFHTDWLNMMYPRLKMARDLLTDDGVIFISIDDNEVHNLRKICDEIFGGGNFYGMLIQQKGSTQNDAKTIQRNADYILCYAKKTEEYLVTYTNYVEKEVFEESWYLGRDTGAFSGHDKLIDRINLASKLFPNFNYYYDKRGNIHHAVAVEDYKKNNINIDSTEQEVYTDVKELLELGYVKIRPPMRKGNKLGRWTWSLEGFKKKWNNNEVCIKNNKNVIQKIFINHSVPIIEKNSKQYIRIGNKLALKNVLEYSSAKGSEMVNLLFPENHTLFTNPKNLDMIKLFIQSSSKSNSIILDFFSGSATTAHAVMQLNAEDGGNRKYIMVQLPAETPEDSEARKAGYSTICEIGKERIRRAGEKIKKDYPDANIDTGFRVFKLDSSNMEDVYYEAEKLSQQDISKTISNIKADRSNEDLLFQIILSFGIKLTCNIEIKQVNNRAIYFVDDTYLLLCFEKDIDEKTIEKIAKMKPEIMIFNQNTQDSTLANIEQIFKQLSSSTILKLI